jgi:hypothetical protein
LALVLLATGCGGENDYSLTKTRSCLERDGVRTGGNLDFVASTAPAGAFVANLDDNFVTVVFGENDSNADELEAAYNRFAFSNVKEGLPDVLRRDRNAIMLWHKHPADADLATVTGCLE